MSHALKTHILEAEERLRLAMLDSDVEVLEELLAPGLVFTNHLGHVLGKEEDLAAHRSGLLEVRRLTPTEQRLQCLGETVIVFVKVHLVGRYADEHSDAMFRFTRVWAPSPGGGWQVVAAHSSLVV